MDARPRGTREMIVDRPIFLITACKFYLIKKYQWPMLIFVGKRTNQRRTKPQRRNAFYV